MVTWFRRIVEALHCAVQKRIKKTNLKESHVDPIILCPRRWCFVLRMSWFADGVDCKNWYEISLNKTAKTCQSQGILKIEENPQFDMQKLMERTRAFLHCKNSTPWCIAGIELNKSFGDLRSPLLGTQALWGTLSSTLRFECTSDTSTSHKKQEANWDQCGGERVVFSMPLCHAFHDSVRTLRFMAFRLVSQTVCQMIFTMQPVLSNYTAGWLQEKISGSILVHLTVELSLSAEGLKYWITAIYDLYFCRLNLHYFFLWDIFLECAKQESLLWKI